MATEYQSISEKHIAAAIKNASQGEAITSTGQAIPARRGVTAQVTTPVPHGDALAVAAPRPRGDASAEAAPIPERITVGPHASLRTKAPTLRV